MQAIVRSLEHLADDPEVDPAVDFPVSLEEAWPYSQGAVVPAMKVIQGQPKVLVSFTQALLDNFSSRTEKVRMVALHLLFVFLSDEVPDAVSQMVASLQAPDPESRDAPLIHELTKAIS